MSFVDPNTLFILVLAPAFGSFLAVLVDRLIAGQSVLAPSACAACDRRLNWRDMVPIASALWLGGKCRHCPAAIPAHLIKIEVAAFMAAIIAVFRASSVVEMWLLALVLWCLIALFYTDLLHFRLPDPLTGGLAVLALLWVWGDPTRSMAEAIMSGIGAALAFWIIRFGYFVWRKREGLGLGDIKLIAGIGILVGWQSVPVVVLVAALLALAVSLVDHLRGKTADWSRPLPFGSYLTAAAAAALLI